MMQTTCRRDGDHWVINGRKAFITGAQGAEVGIVMVRSDDGACMCLVSVPDPAIRIERVLDTIDSSMPGDPRHRGQRPGGGAGGGPPGAV